MNPDISSSDMGMEMEMYEVADSSFVMNGIDIGSQNSNDDTTAEVEPLTEEKHVPSFCLKNKVFTTAKLTDRIQFFWHILGKKYL
mmetsp:Transcript_20900/g.25353  ORF Transcript_20900/g.25353 Transcript_20900/m.25353 type:complete len:85 (+) Transcript_20900:291-545(+)